MEVTESIQSIKRAATEYNIHDLIANRYSPRAFQDKSITEDALNRLFEAMRWAPSSMNEQPWRIIYARKGDENYDKIVDTLMEGNKIWAKEAPILMLTLVKSTFENGSTNRSARHDLGLAIGTLTIQATHEGIGLHQMGGFSPKQAETAFEIPDGYEAVTAIALGHFGDPETLPSGLAKREKAKRQRKPIKDFVFHGKFGG